MKNVDTAGQLTVNLEPHAVREAALIWARAKDRRDQDPEPATVGDTMPGIHRRLSINGATLLLARLHGACLGFTLFAPREATLEIFYLAVDPDSWGTGVAGSLLAGAEDHARDMGRSTLELWVISSNERAIGVYERHGFVDTGQVKRDAGSRQTELRLIKELQAGRS